MKTEKICVSRTPLGQWLFIGTGGLRRVLGVREYSEREVIQILEWLSEREAGYPKRDLPWPLDTWTKSDEEGATWAKRTRHYMHDGRPVPPFTVRTRGG